MHSTNIFPNHDTFIERLEKEKLIKQKGMVLWFTGLSASGKSTLARELERRLYNGGFLTQVLDGDKLRNGLSKDLGFSEDDRIENIRRIAEVSKLFCECGIVAISAFISPTNSIREMAREIIGIDNFYIIYLSTPLHVCEERDPKGLYKKARAGIIEDFTGVSAPYEAPQDANLIVDTSEFSVQEATELIYNTIIKVIKD